MCHSSSTCSIHGLVTCSTSIATSSADRYERFHGLGTTASSSRCGGSTSRFLSSFSRGSFSTKSTIACDQQESPPAWTQEAYRPPCSEYSFCPGRGGGYLTGYPPRGGPGAPPGGVTWPGTPPGGGVPDRPPPYCLMAFWEMLQSIMGYGYPPLWTDRLMDGQTRVKTLPSLVLRTRAVITATLSFTAFYLIASNW